MTDHITINGVEIDVVDETEAETCDMVVCGNSSYFDDDVQTVCADCGTAIVHRPYAPKTPPKICVACAIARVKPGSDA